MSRVFVFVVLLSAYVFGDIKSEVLSVDKNIVTIKEVNGAKPMQSAFVVRNFDDTNAALVAKCTIDKQDKTKMVCQEHDFLYQDSLYLAKSDVKVGDEVYIGLLSKGATIIAPDLNSYIETKEIAKEKYTIFHADLFAIKLYDDSNPAPKKEDFVEYCKDNFIGTLFFAFSDGIEEVDCLSFASLGKIDAKINSKELNAPFYNRVGMIERGIFDFDNEEVVDFDKYYKKLIGVE